MEYVGYGGKTSIKISQEVEAFASLVADKSHPVTPVLSGRIGLDSSKLLARMFGKDTKII